MNVFTRIPLSTPAFVLVALMAPACVLETKVGASPVDGPDTDGSSSLEPGETETGGPDPSETETGGPGPGETETGEPDPGETETGGSPSNACKAPDPAAQATVEVDLAGWPNDTASQYIDAGECTVESATSESGVIDLVLRCSEGELVDMPVGLHVTGPEDFGVDLVAGDAVKLAAYWQIDNTDFRTGGWFALRDATDSLLFAGLDYYYTDAPQDNLAPLTVVVDDGVCEPDCAHGCKDPEWDTFERLGLGFTHESGPGLELTDESRGELLADGERYDIVVAHAEHWACITCSRWYRWIVRRADQP